MLILCNCLAGYLMNNETGVKKGLTTQKCSKTKNGNPHYGHFWVVCSFFTGIFADTLYALLDSYDFIFIPIKSAVPGSDGIRISDPNAKKNPLLC